jgi:hypothetical protein
MTRKVASPRSTLAAGLPFGTIHQNPETGLVGIRWHSIRVYRPFDELLTRVRNSARHPGTQRQLSSLL